VFSGGCLHKFLKVVFDTSLCHPIFEIVDVEVQAVSDQPQVNVIVPINSRVANYG
jgi:hypothetical protein